MDLAKYFIIAFVLSALGTIPIGLITLTIAQKTIEKGKRAGWQIALGATIMEFIYTLIALYGLESLSLESSWKIYMQIGTFFIFLILGIYYLFKPPSKSKKINSSNQQIDFLQGIGVGMMNMLIVPFWLVVGVWLQSNGIQFENLFYILWFSVGSALGALLIFGVYVQAGDFILHKGQWVTEYANKIIGGLFLILAVIQLIQLL